jgi:Tol biopolymer transport system component
VRWGRLVVLLAIIASPAAGFLSVAGCSANNRTDGRAPAAGPVSATAAHGDTSAASTVATDDVVFVRANHVWRAHPDGTGARQLTSGRLQDASPAWSPDRKAVAFVRSDQDAAQDRSWLCVVPASGGAVRSWEFESVLSGICYSPDGGKIAFGDLGQTSSEKHRVRIAVFDLASRKTQYVARLEGHLEVFAYALNVSWSPDGSGLLVAQGFQDDEGNSTGILTLATRKLVWLKTPDAVQSRWAPSGRLLVTNQFTQRYSAVSIASRAGKIKRQLDEVRGEAANDSSVEGGSFSPDGSHVAFVRSGDTDDVWVVGVDGKGMHKAIADASAVAWSSQ